MCYTHKECGVTVTHGRQGIRQEYTSTNSEFISLLSLIPPPHMVAPSRELANIQNSPFSQPANNPLNNNYSNQDLSSSMEVNEFTQRGHKPQSTKVSIH